MTVYSIVTAYTSYSLSEKKTTATRISPTSLLPQRDLLAQARRERMGANQSVSDGTAPRRGLHVLRVTPSSPAARTDIEPFFDFIVGYEDVSTSVLNANIEAHNFEKVVEQHEDRRLDLIIWSSKRQTIRREWTLVFHLEPGSHTISPL